MRILHTSDWHLGRALENISRLPEQQEFVDTLCHLVKEEKIDLILISGISLIPITRLQLRKSCFTTQWSG